MDFNIASFAVWFLAFLFSTTCHEAAHAWAAHKGGDPTAYDGGQVTLDPLPHIKREPFGMILAPILSFATLGWMMGWASAPYDPSWGRRHPQRQALMALAGPSANLVLAVVSFITIKLLIGADVFEIPRNIDFFSGLVVPREGIEHHSLLGAVATLLSVMLSLNFLLGLFNLMPVPPLDGAAVLEGLFPKTLGRLYEGLRSAPMFQLLGLLIAWNLFPRVSGPAFSLLLQLVVN